MSESLVSLFEHGGPPAVVTLPGGVRLEDFRQAAERIPGLARESLGRIRAACGGRGNPGLRLALAEARARAAL